MLETYMSVRLLLLLLSNLTFQKLRAEHLGPSTVAVAGRENAICFICVRAHI